MAILRRTSILITVVAFMLATMALSGGSALAQAASQSSCFGKYASTKETQDAGPGSAINEIATTLGQLAPGGDEHAAQVLNQIRVETEIC